MQTTPPSHVVSLEAVESVRREISHLFTVFDTSLDQPESGYVRFRGRFLKDPADCFDALRAIFERFGFTPQIRDGQGGTALIGLPHVFRPAASRASINFWLFIATVLSTLWVGAAYEATSLEETFMLWRGWPFSLSIMLILGAHEMGHYFAARYHGVPVTLPYFIPLPGPISLIGTMGAFIRIKAPVKNRRALFDIGAAGPWAGLLFAVPILYIGLVTSATGPLPLTAYTLEGNSLLYAAMKFLVFGQFLPAGGVDVQLNQVAWAGWVGLLVTSLNLMPVGQLDGGHVAFVLFGQKARQLYWPVIIGLAALVLLTGALTWLFWIVLIFFLGRTYAEPLDDVTELDPRRRFIAIGTLVLFVLLFMPVPLQIITP